MSSSSTKPVLVVFTQHTKLLNSDKTTGCYLPEIAHPYLRFKKAGIKLIAATPNGGEAPLDPSSLEAFKEDAESQEWLNDSEAQEWRKNTKKLSEVDQNVENYSAIFFPGGHGPCFDLPVDEDSKRFIRDFYEAGKIVSAVCHAPAVFSDVKVQDGSYLLKGRTVTSFTNEEEEQAGMTKMIPWLVESRLVERGATFQKAEQAWGEKVVVDRDSSNGRILITGQNPASAGKMAEEVLKALGQ